MPHNAHICFFCQKRTHPEAVGYCSYCSWHSRPGGRDDGDDSYSYPFESGPSPQDRSWLEISLVVFGVPFFSYLFYLLAWGALLLLVSPVLAWSEALRPDLVGGTQGLAVLLGLVSGIVFCIRMWPEEEPPTIW